ncbi:MAG: hypothetical protein U0736_23170 [Gemmataceae bacterium]
MAVPAPLDSTDPIPPAEHACLMRAMREVAAGWEILDRREHNYVLLRADDFAADAHLLRSAITNWPTLRR